jgi:hypothetical protein
VYDNIRIILLVPHNEASHFPWDAGSHCL